MKGMMLHETAIDHVELAVWRTLWRKATYLVGYGFTRFTLLGKSRGHL